MKIPRWHQAEGGHWRTIESIEKGAVKVPKMRVTMTRRQPKVKGK
jgi:hypothetical protein